MLKTAGKTLSLIAATALISACSPTLRTHGYIATEDAKPQQVKTGEDTKATVLARLGNPSIKGTFDEKLKTDTWYYMTAVRQRYAYQLPTVSERTVTAVTFSEDGKVTKVAEYGVEDGQYVDYVSRKTPTRGRELSVLEQIFGTIGRLPTDRIGGDQNIPGGSGSGR